MATRSGPRCGSGEDQVGDPSAGGHRIEVLGYVRRHPGLYRNHEHVRGKVQVGFLTDLPVFDTPPEHGAHDRSPRHDDLVEPGRCSGR